MNSRFRSIMTNFIEYSSFRELREVYLVCVFLKFMNWGELSSLLKILIVVP